jgi:hypothetical protein
VFLSIHNRLKSHSWQFGSICPWVYFAVGWRYIFNYTLTYLFTYSMEQSPSWEANCFCIASEEIPRIYGTRKFITVPTGFRHMSLTWSRSIQSPLPTPTSWRSILILSFHLRLALPNVLLPSGCPTKTLCTPFNYTLTTVNCSLQDIFICS